MLPSKITVSKYKIALIMLFSALLLGICLYAVPLGKGAYADKQKTIAIEQTEEVVFSGDVFVDGDGKFPDTDPSTAEYENELFNSLVFKIDGQPIPVAPEDVTVSYAGLVSAPKGYPLSFSIEYGGTTYSVKTSLIVSKRLVTVTTLLNGRTDLTVDEGTDVTLAYNYQNAVSAHTEQLPYDGYSVTSIRDSYLTVPAWADVDTKKPIQRCRVVAAHAASEYYDFKYVASFLTINAKPTRSLTYSADDRTLLVMVGSFSVLNSVQFTDIGVSSSSGEYSVISAAADVFYKDSGFFDEYEKLGCFSVNVLYDNNAVTEDIPATYTVYQPSLSDSRGYKVVALYKNGKSEVLNATLTEGYLTFNADDVGDFIVVSPTEGLSNTYLVLAIAGGVGVLVVVILLFSVFRRKY